MVDRRTGAWYPSYYGQTPDTDPEFLQVYGNRVPGVQPNTQQGGNAAGQQTMTPPTIHADIIQIDNLDMLDRHPVAAGTSQLFATKDEEHFVIRSVMANGEHSDVFYDRRPPTPPEPKINPAEYVRRDEISALIAETIQSMKGAK